jgi:hypothetical protein
VFPMCRTSFVRFPVVPYCIDRSPRRAPSPAHTKRTQGPLSQREEPSMSQLYQQGWHLSSQSGSQARLFEPWGQYVRTDQDGKMKGGAGEDGKSKEGR